MIQEATSKCERSIGATIQQLDSGKTESSEELLQALYTELRKLAASRLRKEMLGQTLQPTALVHEAYLRLTDKDDRPKWSGRGHFFGAASTAMRRILIERARKKRTLRAGGKWQRVKLDEIDDQSMPSTVDLLSLNQALTELAQQSPRKAKLVELRFFAGLSNREAANVLGISPSTADLDWRYARAWLKVAIDGMNLQSPS